MEVNLCIILVTNWTTFCSCLLLNHFLFVTEPLLVPVHLKLMSRCGWRGNGRFPPPCVFDFDAFRCCSSFIAAASFCWILQQLSFPTWCHLIGSLLRHQLDALIRANPPAQRLFTSVKTQKMSAEGERLCWRFLSRCRKLRRRRQEVLSLTDYREQRR